jgi:hypothetical protein
MANCGVCAREIEGREARKCPIKKCNNPICLICDPLETKTSKVKGGVRFLSDLVQGDIASLVYDDLSKRVRCNSCSGKDKNQERWIIASVIALFAGMFSLPLFRQILEDLLDTNIGGMSSLIIFIIIFTPVLIYTKKLLMLIYYPSK